MAMIVNGKGFVGIRRGTVVSPSIVTDGLKLYLDAGNTSSYPGTGTVWNDISGNGNNGTLVNGGSGLSFNSANGGNIVFDGTNDYIQTPISSSLNFCNSTNDLPFTTSVWCYINNLGVSFSLYNKGDNGDGVLESYANYVGSDGKYTINLYDTNGGNQTIAKTTSTILTSTWVNLTTTYSGIGGASGINLYVNGILQSKTTSSSGTYTRMRVQNTNLFLGSFGSTGAHSYRQTNGRFSNFLFYNRNLSATELTQNYNALKSRYGL